ncbi:MAG TPA: molybdopterin cofactor-binding domain-containing protein, partial [Beijerinckiaceae bacterium]
MIPNTLPQSLIDHPRLDQWIAFEDGGTVRVATGKVELGQGILTALVQIAAEELDVAPERLHLVSGETGHTPNEGYTAGSLSVEVSGGSIRLVCAETRALFLDLAAAGLACPVAELTVEDGRIRRKGADTGLDYWALAERVDLTREIRGNALTKRPAEFRVIGQSVPRRDLPDKIFGAPFVHDLAPPGLLHARVLRQPWRGARLAALDDAAIRRAAKGPFELFREGDFVAFLAEDETVAAAAVERARELAAWDGGERLAAEHGEPGWVRTQATVDRIVQPGDAPAGQPVTTVAASYTKPFIAHGSIGPSCALALCEDGRLTVWTHSQGVYLLRNAIARGLGLDFGAVSVLHRQGAGCYGHNGADDAAFDAALVALRRPGRPVRVLWSREDELSASPFGTAMAIDLKAGLGADGRPVGWEFSVTSPPHGQRPGMNQGVNLLGAAALPNPPPVPDPQDVPDARGGGATRNAVALYDIPQRVVHRFVPHLPVRTSSMRGLGAFGNVFAIESFMDELAAAGGEDPVRYRLSLMSDPRARNVIETAAAMAGWRADEDSGSGRAKGIAFSRYKNRAAYLALVVEVEVEEEVRMRRAWCAMDAGMIVNPDGAVNQVEGGIIQAASWTLKEQVRFADGRVATDRGETYPSLRFSEVPEVEVRLVGSRDAEPLGVGEAAQGPTAAAIANA